MKACSQPVACPLCGAALGGRSGCQKAFEELQARTHESPVRAAVHNLVIDAYAMQHSEEYGKSAKSYIAHLTALCCVVEAPDDKKLYWGIPRWLDGPAKLPRPSDIASRGKITIADARGASDREYADTVRQWAGDVWAAYVGEHELARQCLREVRAHAATGRKA